MTGVGGNLSGAVLSRRFRLVRKIGEGGMGAVYAADIEVPPNTMPGADRISQLLPGRTCAIKILHPEFLGNLPVLSRFLDEGRFCQRLIHPNILRVYEAAEAEDGSPYIVMELLDGVPLGAYTANGGRVPPAQAVPILQGILAGLATAHAQGVIHRDLKPDNVYLARDGSGQFAVKVLDFGIAKVMDAAGGMGSKTKTGMLLGTPAYMSPEQVRNAKDVDARADLWSCGVMFYEMLTGRVAFAAPTEYARLSAILTATPTPLERVDPTLAPFAAVVNKALSKEREHRFQSALEMARALAAALSGDDNEVSRLAIPTPLHDLPDVPSLYAPSVIHPSPAAIASEAAITAAAPPSLASPANAGPPMKTPGGTLASPAEARGTPQFQSSRPGPNVVVVAGDGMLGGGTLPSHDLPMLSPVGHGAPRIPSVRRGITLYVVFVLVGMALLAGFALGYVFAKNL